MESFPYSMLLVIGPHPGPSSFGWRPALVESVGLEQWTWTCSKVGSKTTPTPAANTGKGEKVSASTSSLARSVRPTHVAAMWSIGYSSVHGP